MKNKRKIFIICMLLFFIINILTINTSYGSVSTLNDLDGGNVSPSVKLKLDQVGNSVITIITTVGSIISVIVLIVIGIKYMMGSVEEKAEYKKTLLPFVIGAIILFACSNLAGIIYNIAINL